MTKLDEGRQGLDLPEDWRVEDFADPDLMADFYGSRRVEERGRQRLRQRQAAIAEERARRG